MGRPDGEVSVEAKGLKQVWLELKPKVSVWVGHPAPKTREEKEEGGQDLLRYKSSIII